MNEEMRLLLKLTEENARYRTAFKYLKAISEKDIKKGYSGDIDKDELEDVLRIAGIKDHEINVITFDNTPEEVAYAGN